MESPVQSFSRYAINAHRIGDLIVRAHSRVIVLYGSANRDERFWEDAERFDVRRPNVSDQIAFGHGEHACAGMSVARLEMTELFTALAKRVTRFDLHSAKRVLNNTLRGFETVEVTVH